MHHPIQFKSVSLTFSGKTCFEHFSATIHAGDRIGIIGRNGSGKSSLLKLLLGQFEPSSGEINMPGDLCVGYVEQQIHELDSFSGAERFNQRLTKAMSLYPDVLVLDEPTNHLDKQNRQSLFKMLKHFAGTVVIVSHDEELLEKWVDRIWHIDQGQAAEFTGRYSDYLNKRSQMIQALEQNKSELTNQKKKLHEKRMKEQAIAAKSNARGKKSIQNKKWATIKSAAKMGRSLSASNKKIAQMKEAQDNINETLKGLSHVEVITPSFDLSAFHAQGSSNVLQVNRGSVGYGNKTILSDLSFSLAASEKLAICGKNGCGKTTLLKAIMSNPCVRVSGDWHVPKQESIGYLDQHYQLLNPDETVLETIERVAPHWKHDEVRKHLNAYLFRKNEEVNLKTRFLSGGEKVRLFLAKIAACPPTLLILDEVTNNLDIETKAHVIQILKDYPGAMIVVSHNAEFLEKIDIHSRVDVDGHKVV